MRSIIGTLLNAQGRDLGLDLGTSSTLAYVRGRGIVLAEPSIVLLDERTREVIAAGSDALKLAESGRRDATLVRPLENGTLHDIRTAGAMLRHFLDLIGDGRLDGRAVLSLPARVTDEQRRAVGEMVLAAGAREVHTLEAPVAAGIGAGLPVTEPVGSLVVDVGGGVTDVALLSLGGVVSRRTLCVAGNEIDGAIARFAREELGLIIGGRMAEGAKIVAGSALPLSDERHVILRGRDARTGERRAMEVSSTQLHEAIREPVEAIARAVRETVSELPPELASDVAELGITLVGGGALLLGLDRRVAQEAGAPVRVADAPLTCAVRGAGRVAGRPGKYQAVLRPV